MKVLSGTTKFLQLLVILSSHSTTMEHLSKDQLAKQDALYKPNDQD